MTGRLVLFDIDGTLVDTGGAGMRSLREAARDLFGEDGPDLDLAGSTDEGLVRGILEHFGEPFSPGRVAEFYGAYLGHLERHLESGAFRGRVLPGVIEILDACRDAGAVLGLLTGNIAEGAAMKVRHYGMEGYFGFGAYGDDHHDRNLLGPIALERAREATGVEFVADEAVVVGDTPKDIACGRALGATTVCVATGAFSARELRDHGADLVFETFVGVDPLVTVKRDG